MAEEALPPTPRYPWVESHQELLVDPVEVRLEHVTDL